LGGSTRIKGDEAMAMEKAMVPATVGTERLPVRNGEHLSIADDPVQFASEIVYLLRQDIEGRNRLENNAKSFVPEIVSWGDVPTDIYALDGRPK
jgi:hypothetical protein